jgi:DNA-binding response OmpR family regulator
MTRHTPASLLRIAVVEDDIDLLDTTVEYLRAQGYPAWGVTSAEAFYKRLTTEAVDLVVLDIGLPGEDGITVALQLRERPDLTIIIVSARGALGDRLVGLEAGADRYLVKPVNLVELVANIESVGRRRARTTSNPEGRIQEGGGCALWRLATDDWDLSGPGGKITRLTGREYFLLHTLIEAKGEVVTRKALIAKIIGTHVINGGERLDVLIARLRKKSAEAFGHPLPIKTVHQVGYAFTSPAILD